MIPKTLFIPLGNGSTWNNNELKYALRSWEMYSTIDRVIICGEKPEWYTGEHIPYRSRLQYSKPMEIMDKAKQCPAEVFIFSNDDIFLLEFMFELPNYAQGKIENFRGGSEAYMRYVHATATYWFDGWYYDVHTPMVMDTEILGLIDTRPNQLFKSAYGNFRELRPTPYIDFKIDHYVHGADIDGLVAGKPFLSIGDNCGWDVKRWIMNRWPNKSKWEI